MAIPTAVNGQITDALTLAHSTGGDDALNSIGTLLTVIAQSMADAKGGKADELLIMEISMAFRKSEAELHQIIRNLKQEDLA